MKNVTYLFLEPYVYISLKKDRALLYNTLNNKMLTYSKGQDEYGIIKKLNSDKNLLVVELEIKNLSPALLKFIKTIKFHYFGDLFQSNTIKKIPVQYKKVINDQTSKYTLIGNGTEILTKIDRINIYVNSECEHNCELCKLYYKQVKYCTKIKKNEVIDIAKLIIFLRPLKQRNVTINILGGNVLKYSKLGDLISSLKILKLNKIVYLNIKNINIDMMKDKYRDVVFNVLIDYNEVNNVIIKKLKLLINSKLNIIYNFVIKNNDNLNKVSDFIEKNKISSYVLNPIYKDNYEFFKEQVFVDKNDLENVKLNYKEIAVRSVLNTYKHGQLTIKSNGKVFSSFNSKSLGTIEDQIQAVIYKELHKGKNWLENRNSYLPCKHCIYSELCPPITEYEKFIGQKNICKGMV